MHESAKRVSHISRSIKLSDSHLLDNPGLTKVSSLKLEHCAYKQPDRFDSKCWLPPPWHWVPGAAW